MVDTLLMPRVQFIILIFSIALFGEETTSTANTAVAIEPTEIIQEAIVDTGPKPNSEAVKREERLRSNARDLAAMQLADSVSWEKMKLIQGKNQPTTRQKALRRKRKQANLLAFCTASRLNALVELDSLKTLSREDKAFCLERLTKPVEALP